MQKKKGKGSCYLRICFWFKQTRLSLIKEIIKQKIPRFLNASSASREAAVNDNSIYQKIHFFTSKFCPCVRQSERRVIQSVANKDADSIVQRAKKEPYVRHLCLHWYPYSCNTTQYTPFLILKKNGFNFENCVLLKLDYWRKIDALLFHLHSQTSTEIISLAPKVWNPSPPSSTSICFKRELWRLWIQVPFGHLSASFPSAEAIHRLCKKTGAFQHLKMDFFLSFLFSFLAGTILFFMNLFLV